MLKVLEEIFILYIVYKIVFGFIIPVYSASKQMNKKMNAFKQQMQQNYQQQQQNTNPQSGYKAGNDDDYIDYEEIK